MKTTLIFAAATIGLLAACTPEAPMETSMEASMEPMAATAATPFIGKSLTAGETTFLFMADGTIGGSMRGEAIVGTYNTSGAEICSTYSAPERLTGREWCSTPTISGSSVVFDRRDGSQSPAYTISG